MTVQEVTAWVRTIPTDLVVITGGEPLLQRRPLDLLVGALSETGRRVEIETSGVLPPSKALLASTRRFVVSPKLANSELIRRHRVRPAALAAFAASGKAVFKFVVESPAELDEVAALAEAHSLAPVWIMPEGITSDAVTAGLRALAGPVLAHGWNLTGRLHVQVWGDERGR